MTFVCCISGVIPEEPVISKTGFVFEKRLIEEYILCNNCCPITKSELKLEDLIEIKSSNTVKPRLIKNTSIPGILDSLRTEWDAIMLELFELRRELEQTKMQLTHSLYQHDASCRVIARIKRERDEAINKIKEIQTEFSNVNEVDVSSQTTNKELNNNKRCRNNSESSYVNIPKNIEDLFVQYSERMKPIRKKLSYPNLLSKEDMKLFEFKKKILLNKSYKLQTSVLIKNNIVSGFNNGDILIHNIDIDKEDIPFVKVNSSNYGKICQISAIDISDDNKDRLPRFILSTYQNLDEIKIFSKNNEEKYENSSIKLKPVVNPHIEIDSIEVHPLKKYFITNSFNSNLFSLFDLENEKQLSCYYLDENNSYSDLKIHPDGLIIGGIVSQGKKIDIWDIRSLEKVSVLNYQHEKISQGKNSICFSNNGYYLFTTSSDCKVHLWDLRKSTILDSIDLNFPKSNININFDFKLSIDESGKYLSFWNYNQFSVFSLLEKHKIEKLISFSEESEDDHIKNVYFGQNANSIYTLNYSSVVKLWSKA